MKPSAPLDLSPAEDGFSDRLAEALAALQNEMQSVHGEPEHRQFTDDERADLMRHAGYHARVLAAQPERDSADRV